MKFLSFFKRHWILTAIAVVILVVIGLAIRGRNKSTSNVLTDTVKKQDLTQTVLATGQVSSTTDLSLSFKGSGVVSRVNVLVGQPVKNGTILASLDQRDQAAGLTQARGSLAQAQANYNKVIAGASGPDVDIAKAGVASAQTTLNNAKASYNATVSQQNTIVANAFSAMLNSGIAAFASTSDSSAATVTVSGTYTGTAQGGYNLKIFYSGNGAQYSFSGLETGNGVINRGVAQALGSRGLYITFSNSGTIQTNIQWNIPIPNTQASTYNTNYNAYQAALQTQQQAVLSAQNAVNSAQASLDQANASLAQKQSAARPEDVAAARAQILSASGQVQAASASLENMIIRAPSGGTITSVGIKVGEQATPGKAAIVLQDVTNLHVEANVSEANIAQVQTAQSVSFTFDALGPARTFTGTVVAIDPASTVVSGVVNYKVTASVDKLAEIKPGMTANMTIQTAAKPGVLVVPARAIVDVSGKHYVRVIDDSKKKTYHQVEVTEGLQGDGGLVEILSGLTLGQEIVAFINTK